MSSLYLCTQPTGRIRSVTKFNSTLQQLKRAFNYTAFRVKPCILVESSELHKNFKPGCRYPQHYTPTKNTPETFQVIIKKRSIHNDEGRRAFSSHNRHFGRTRKHSMGHPQTSPTLFLDLATNCLPPSFGRTRTV